MTVIRKKQIRVYVDTSVFGGVFDNPIEIYSPLEVIEDEDQDKNI